MTGEGAGVADGVEESAEESVAAGIEESVAAGIEIASDGVVTV